MNDNIRKIVKVTLGVILIVGLVIALLYNREVKKTNYTPPSSDNSVDAESHKQYATDDKSESYIISQDFVKKCMIYPRETKFIEPYGYIHEKTGQNKCTVIGKFVTKNTYGVEIEYVYKIWLTHNGDEWEDINNWQCSKLKIESVSTGETKVFTNVQ